MASKVGSKAIGCCGSFCSGFKEFILRGNVVDLAVAVVVGGAFKELVNAFVAAFITPLFGMIGSSDATKNLSFTANGATFPYGLFIDAVISFIIICLIVYTCIVLPLMGLMNRLFPIRTCPECMQEDIPITATRCKYCCSTLQPTMKVSKSGNDLVPTGAATVAPSSQGGMSSGVAPVAAVVTDLPSELQRHFQGLRELDLRVTALQKVIDEDCLAQLKDAAERQQETMVSPSKRQKVTAAAAAASTELAQRIEHNMNEVIKLSEEKMNRAQQIYDYIDQHIRKLDKDLKSFEAEVAKERQRLGLPAVPGTEGDLGGAAGADGRRKRGAKGGAPPPEPVRVPTSEELYQAALAVADATEPTYCYCNRISFGEMIACEHLECPIEWFHFECVGLTPENRPKGKWYCKECKKLLGKK